MGCETHFFFAEMESELNILINSFFDKSGYRIIELLERGEKGTKVIEIFVDNENGINIDELAKLNRELNALIDEKFVIKDISKIVISSPGAERPFKYFWQLKKHEGRLLEIELNSGEKFEGRLINTESDEEILMTEIQKKEKGKSAVTEQRAVRFNEIKESKVKISFNKK